jgi:hypothetical protein
LKGDIFSDLFQALNRRRKGIAEKQREVSAAAEEYDNICLEC